jgi:hypothetical protein
MIAKSFSFFLLLMLTGSLLNVALAMIFLLKIVIQKIVSGAGE